MVVIIEPHNPEWLKEFQTVKAQLQASLKDVSVVSIEHVGSTAIPGLVAKPVLDIDIVVKPEHLESVRRALVVAGYEDRGDLGVPERVAFRVPAPKSDDVKEIPTIMPRNTYVVIDGCVSLQNHFDLKRVLLEDASLRQEYGDVKRALVARGTGNVDDYCRGKNEVMQKILRKAGWAEDDLEAVRKANE